MPGGVGALAPWGLSLADRRCTRGLERPAIRHIFLSGAIGQERQPRRHAGNSESTAAVMTVEVGGWSSILAGPSLLQVSEMKQNNMGTVNNPPRSLASARRQSDLLKLQQDVLEPMISKGTALGFRLGLGGDSMLVPNHV